MKNKQPQHFPHDKSDYEVELKATSENKNARKYSNFFQGIKTKLWQFCSNLMHGVNGEQVILSQNVIFSDSDFLCLNLIRSLAQK